MLTVKNAAATLTVKRGAAAPAPTRGGRGARCWLAGLTGLACLACLLAATGLPGCTPEAAGGSHPHLAARRKLDPDPYRSPNLLVDGARLREIARLARTAPTMQEALERLLASARERLALAPDPVEGVLRVPSLGRDPKGHTAMVHRLLPQMQAMHTLALAHALTGEAAFGEAARALLYAWVGSTSGPADAHPGTSKPRGDTALVCWFTLPNAIYAFDLLEGCGRLSEAEAARFRAWLRGFVSYRYEPHPRWDNKEDWHLLFLGAAAHVLHDPPLLAEAVSRYERAIRCQVAPDGSMPRELRRGRKSTTYTLMALEPLTMLVHIAEAHGYRGLREVERDGAGLREALVYLARFLQEPGRWRRHYRGEDLRLPSGPSAWGYLFELPLRWWREPDLLRVTGARPYQDPHEWKGYALGPATLLFYDPATHDRDRDGADEGPALQSNTPAR